MKWCRLRRNGKAVYGYVDGVVVRCVDGDPFGSYRTTQVTVPTEDADLLAPCDPRMIYAAGGPNYHSHAAWASDYFGRDIKVPARPEIGYRAVTAVIGNEAPIILPADTTGQLHFEGELAGVVGQTGRHLSREEALSCVLGYTICNDITERGWQASDQTTWRSKNADTFKPVGPWITTPEEFDIASAHTEVRINGEMAIRFRTGELIHDLADHLVEISRYCTLHPGDIVLLGTDGPTTPSLRPGDVVEVEVSGLGVLRNPVVSERAQPGVLRHLTS
jgi:2-keto-4-pentenoate hydratase/2-oxohepta-3-ene-1,7-dioic acid hydratase in catechol pathway